MTATALPTPSSTKGSTVTDASSTPADIPAVIAGAKLWLDATNIDGQNNATITDATPLPHGKI